jgi:hypothetical protein
MQYTDRATITDDAERARMLASVKMRAVEGGARGGVQARRHALREYLATPIEIPPSLVWPTIAVRGEITTTLGRAGKGKTTMNLNRIFAWACGRSLFPGWTDHDGNEYLKPERPLRPDRRERGQRRHVPSEGRAAAHKAPHQGRAEMCLDNLYVHGDGGYSGMKLDNDAGVDKLRAGDRGCEPDIVFIEPFRSLWRGEENSATDMAKVVDNLVAPRHRGSVRDHPQPPRAQGRRGRRRQDVMPRGSTVLEGVVAVMENFESASRTASTAR